jgi:hypothetical protein
MSVGGPPKEADVYIECILHGGLLKVTAIDSRSGTEACVFGPANARQALTRNAVAKLAYVLKKNT